MTKKPRPLSKKTTEPSVNGHYQFTNREISWLSFNERVLQEAADSTVPAIERLRFLGIYSNNMDEFFRVRVATLKRLLDIDKVKSKAAIHYKPKRILVDIQEIVIKQSQRFDSIFADITQELQQHNIHVLDEKQLSSEQGQFVSKYFREQVRPTLVPIMLNQIKTFPALKDKTIYLAIKLSVSNRPAATQYALIEVPTDLVGRFLVLPNKGRDKFVMLLDDIIRFQLPEVFAIFKFNKFEAWTIKVTRDAELDIDNDISHSLVDKISRSVKMRQKGDPVRFVYDHTIDKQLLNFITGKMKIGKYDNLIPGSRYHNFKDFMGFPNLGDKSLEYPPVAPLNHKLLKPDVSFFDVLNENDVLLNFPYHRFGHLIDLLREAAIDPNVKSIKMTLYRVAKKSKVINALINAAQNGKQVLVVVELQARFDEEANIKWARTLQDQGIQVIYGVTGLKVHAKLCLITRNVGGKTRQYVNITTGNYNEITSRIYCDDSLFTSHPGIAREVDQMFDFFQRNYKVYNYRHLILSPISTRKKMLALIDQEIKNRTNGKPTGIFLKLNSLVDEEMISRLYEASRAGVKIKCVVRGICALVPGVTGMSENIEVISIIDRLLEHSRVYIFENGGNPLYYISSSDWMTRNLDFRIEVTCPIYDEQLQKMIRDIYDIQWADNVKARMIDETGSNAHRSGTGRKKIRAQYAIYDFLKKTTTI